MQKKKSDEYVAYDVTSISSYSKNISELEWGYNRDKERLPQINMGMYYGEESRLPLYYRIYPGSTEITHKKLILELDKIKVFDAHTKAKPRIINPPTKTVRDLIAELDIATDFVCDNFGGVCV